LQPIPTLFPYTTLFRSNPQHTQLNKLLNDNFASIKAFFTDASNGFIQNVQTATKRSIIAPDNGGILFNANDALVNQMQKTDEQRSEEHTSELQSRSDLV